jgi:hypothetical protein
MILRLLYFFYHDYKTKKTGSESEFMPFRVLTSRLRGDDKPYITVTPAQRRRADSP